VLITSKFRICGSANIYKDIIASGITAAKSKDYIRDKIRSGKFLIRSIHQRQQTFPISRSRSFAGSATFSNTARHIETG